MSTHVPTHIYYTYVYTSVVFLRFLFIFYFTAAPTRPTVTAALTTEKHYYYYYYTRIIVHTVGLICAAVALHTHNT